MDADTDPREWRFGDEIENADASHDNPTRRGFFVRLAYRVGAMNSGRYVELTDSRGEFWESNAREGHHLTRIEFSPFRAR